MTALFDPVFWLHEFESAGGEVSLAATGHFCLTRHRSGMTIEQLGRSWALQKEVSEDPTKLVAVWSMLRQQRAA